MSGSKFPALVLRGAAAAAGLAWLTGCGTTQPLPPYEPPMARAQFQTVRTTAYTHTEADHLEYGNHNALGGVLQTAVVPGGVNPPAGAPVATVYPARASADEIDDGAGGFHRPVTVPISDGAAAPPAPMYAPPTIPAYGVGSAAADWSRWPAGTVFRIQSTGQVYKVDDYGWALAGRNTIDLYQPTRAAMNAWGTRHEPIEILRWGDPGESLRMLRNHQGYRHIKRMVLELEGNAKAAAQLE